jgi:hypothetical protein
MIEQLLACEWTGKPAEKIRHIQGESPRCELCAFSSCHTQS